jgi:thioesterase domain-containing protein
MFAFPIRQLNFPQGAEMESIAEKQPPTVPTHVQLIEVWEQALGCKVSSIDENFFELGGHSLLLATMMDEVERVTGKYISIVRFLENPTIRHLAGCLAEEAQNDNEIVLIQPGKTGTVPMFYFHGDILGGGFYARKLAAQLGEDQPVYSVPPAQLTEGAIPTVEDIARQRVQSIRECHPHGPYFIGGFCIGALTAYDVARRLAKAGEEVKGVFLINPHLAGNMLRSHLRIVEKLARRRGENIRETVEKFIRGHRKLERLRDVWNSPLREKAGFVLRNGKKIVRGSASSEMKEEPPGSTPSTNSDRDEWLLSAFEWIATAHVPKPYRRPVTLFLTEDQERTTPFLVRKWRKAARNLEVQHIPGDHLTCITTFGHALAEKLRFELGKLNSVMSLLLSFHLLTEI